MKAIIFDRFGPPDVLQYVDRPIPKPDAGQVCIKVHAAGLNPIDYKIREGVSFVSEKIKAHLPSGLGYEHTGEIVACGKNVNTFDVGDVVLGLAGLFEHPGCYAEYVCADVNNIIRKPDALPFLQASCMTIASLTAFQALQLAGIEKGQKVLIHAGAGGVGHIAVQLAKAMGAYVITTASSRNHEFLYQLGVDHCIDYKKENFSKLLGNIDAVIDLVGGDTGIKSCEVVSSTGNIITVPTITAKEVIAAAKQHGLRAEGIIMKPDMDQLSMLADKVATRALIIEVGCTFSLSQAISAHEKLASGHAKGKLVFSVQ